MNASAEAPERAIRKTVRVPADPARVWEAWTTTEGVVTFFAPQAFVEARVDGAYQIYFNPFAAPGARGADDMRILALQPHAMLSFTWNAPPHLPEARAQRTYVTVRLRSAGAGETDVSLFHGGWGDGGQWDEAFAYFDSAWDTVLGNLRTRFADKPIDWSAFLSHMKAWQAQQGGTQSD